MDRFIEAADWIIWQLTGVEKRNSCTAGYKGMWHKREGYPSKAFFKLLDPRLENLVDEKLSTDIYSLGKKAGEITEKASKLTDLEVGTAVAIANVDAQIKFGWSINGYGVGDLVNYVNEVDAVKVDKTMPKLPVASVLWKPQPSLRDSAEAWILAGGAHHTSFSFVVTPENLIDWAEMSGVECVLINNNTRPLTFRNELRWNEMAWK